MKGLLLAIILSFTLTNTAFASTQDTFGDYMKVWNENIDLAREYLKNAENEFLNGDALQGCVEQRKAAGYGIKATQSLIKAFEVNGSTDDLSGVKAGLAKWEELRDFCG